MFERKVSQALVDAVTSVSGWGTINEKKEETKTVPVSNWEKNKSKLAGAHTDNLKKGYVYVGSEEKEGVLGKQMTNHNYIAKDSSHHKHIMYPSYSLGDDKFELTHLTTKDGARKHYDLNESVKLHEDLDPLQELSQDLLKNYGAKALDSGVAAKKKGDEKTYKKRVDGIANSWTKPVKYDLQKKGWLKKEEVEELEELSDKTLKSYADKSHKDLKDKADKKDFGKTNLLHRAHGMQKVKDRLNKEEIETPTVKFSERFGAAQRIVVEKVEDTTEEADQKKTEQIVELDTNTLKSYVAKATRSAGDRLAHGVGMNAVKRGSGNASIKSSERRALKVSDAEDRLDKRGELGEESEPFGEGFIDKVKTAMTNLVTAPIDRPGAENTHAGKMDHHYNAGMAAKKAGNKTLAKHHENELGRLMKMKEEAEPIEEKNWIAGAIKHPGALHKKLGVPEGEKIPASKLNAAAKAGGTEGKEARLAKTLKGMHHEQTECTPLDKVKELAKSSHKKIRKEMLGVAPDNSTGI